ncbi:amidohydrolase family protein [Jannaschia sp. 2305UL9-9]|uniref:amidohydrolase family protein n=1 Tax=Jannaschia sp. 2305UL9-9 TaxID=3121638 RepID=UPI0035289FB2
MTEILFRGGHIFDPDAPSGMTDPTDLLIRNGRIAAIGQIGDRPGAEVVIATDTLLMPGLINGHFHSPVNHMKGALPSLPLELFMLYESPAVEVLRPSPREAYLRTTLAAIEMLKGGVTAVQDDAFFVPTPEPEIIDAVMQAYADTGLRASVALDQPELPELEKLPFLADLLPPDLREVLGKAPTPDAQGLLDLYDHLIARWHGACDGRLTAAVSCSAPQRVSPDYMRALDDVSRRHDIPYYAHMLETRLQRVLKDHQPRFAGRSLIEYTDDLGLLSKRMNVIHAIWMDDGDYDLIASRGATVAHNPISNLRLGSGVMPWRRIADRGINLCLGTDEAIADDSVNLWQVMKMAGLVHNLSGPDHALWPKASEILRAATQGGARAMLRGDDLGRIAQGFRADITQIDLTALPFTPMNDLRRQLVYCETGNSVLLTMVDGRIVYRHGGITTVDECALLAEARSLFADRQAALREARDQAAEVRPFYEEMLRLAEAQPVDIHRRLPSATDEGTSP